MKRRPVILLLLSVLALTGIAITPIAAKPIQLSYANFPPAPTFPCIQMERWKAEVEKRTNGQVVVKTYPGGTLLGATEMMDGVIAGQADIGNLCMAYQPGRFVLTNLTSLPVDIPDARTGSLVLLDIYEKYKPREFAGVKVLAMFTTAPSNIMSKVPVRSLADLKGLELRASGVPAMCLEAWGASPVGMPKSDYPEALQKGVIEGELSSLESLKDFKFAEMCPFTTITNTVIYPFAVVMNQAKWDSLPTDVQKVMEDLIREQSEWTGRYMDDHVKESVEWSQQNHNLELITLDPAEKARWDALLEPVKARGVAEAAAAGVDAEAVMADIQAAIETHTK
ncbi:MAG: TRAP transporter substrate-binding protein [Desulfobacterales bacterium]